MGTKERIYGSIFVYCGGSSHPDFRQRVSDTLLALESLPTQDEYPPLTRNMFSLTAAHYGTPGLYKEVTVHFGLTVKNINESWDEWLHKFESVLETFGPSEARLHLELEAVPFGHRGTRFEYGWTPACGATTFDRKSWNFVGGPREFGQVLERCREHVKHSKRVLDACPADVNALRTLVKSLARLKDYEAAFSFFERLRSIDQAAADEIPFDILAPWAERQLVWRTD